MFFINNEENEWTVNYKMEGKKNKLDDSRTWIYDWK